MCFAFTHLSFMLIFAICFIFFEDACEGIFLLTGVLYCRRLVVSLVSVCVRLECASLRCGDVGHAHVFFLSGQDG